VSLAARAVALFIVTNVDDLVLLTLFLGLAGPDRVARARVVTGQFLGFALILAASVGGALGAELLPSEVIPYLGLVPLLLGIWAGVQAYRTHGDLDDVGLPRARSAPGIGEVAAVTVANGADNLAVYVPAFAAVSARGIVASCAIFLVLVAVWCVAAQALASRPGIARAIARWGHVALPVVLVGLGLLILVEGGAFGL
jgi:cadmium resistance protein CadD (predicted permease)